MMYMAYDEGTGQFAGWYDDEIHSTIPTPNVVMNKEEYLAYYTLMNDHDMNLFFREGKIVPEKMAKVISWGDIRYSRDLKLKATDWSQARDVPDAIAEKYSAYRQALRDVPQTFNSPESVIWPVKADYGIE